MYYYELFSHPDRFTYRAHILSSTTYVLIVCTTLTFLSPFLLTYYSGDFWPQVAYYSEQPRLANRTKFILVAETDSITATQSFMSSYGTLNNYFQAGAVPGNVAESSSDIDGDGLIDQYRISFDLTFSSTSITIRSINVWLIFQYELRGRQHITMETMALINVVPSSLLQPSSNQNITVYGQLIFEQNTAIQNAGNDSVYNTSIINTDSSLTNIPNMNSILDQYFARKYYTAFKNLYTWTSPRTTAGDTNKVTVSVVVNSGRQSIRYRPGFWQELKWGWIQYISLFLPFMIVFNRLKVFVFTNNLVRTFAPLSIHRHKA